MNIYIVSYNFCYLDHDSRESTIGYYSNYVLALKAYYKVVDIELSSRPDTHWRVDIYQDTLDVPSKAGGLTIHTTKNKTRSVLQAEVDEFDGL